MVDIPKHNVAAQQSPKKHHNTRGNAPPTAAVRVPSNASSNEFEEPQSSLDIEEHGQSDTHHDVADTLDEVPWTATSLDTMHAAFTTTNRITGGIGWRATRYSRRRGAGLALARIPGSDFERLGIEQLCFFVRCSDFFKDRLQQSDCRRTRDVFVSSLSQRDCYLIGLWEKSYHRSAAAQGKNDILSHFVAGVGTR
jgi:hypothetical protein